MSIVDDAVEAGAKAWATGSATPNNWENMTSRLQGITKDRFEGALSAAWPVLSAPLRKLHITGPLPGGVLACHTCLTTYVCETACELDRIDKELGL